MDNQNQIILYQDDNDITRVSVRFADEDLWLTQNQLAEIYCTTQENISMHIRNIYADNELDANRTYKDFLLLHFRHNLRHNLRRAKTFFKKIHSRGKLSKHYTSRVLYIPFYHPKFPTFGTKHLPRRRFLQPYYRDAV